MTDKFENAALFLRLSLLSTLIRHENVLQAGGIRKRRLRVLIWTANILKTKLLKNDGIMIIMWFSCKHNSKMTSDCCVFKFPRRSVDGKHLMRFQSEKTIFKFLRRSVLLKAVMNSLSYLIQNAFPNYFCWIFYSLCLHRRIQILMMMSCWNFLYHMAWQQRLHKLPSSLPSLALWSATLMDTQTLSQLTQTLHSQVPESSLSPLSYRQQVIGQKLGR